MKKVLKAGLIIIGILAVLVVAFLALVYIPTPKFEPVVYDPVTPDYWPTEGFLSTTPEEQGMDSARLVDMVEAYQADHEKNPANSIDSITIIRNGYVVADIYLNPMYPEDTSHILHSCTKSIMSALIGIAIEQGHIDGVDVPVVDFFKDRDLEIVDERMNEVTLEDLLTMQTNVRARDSYIYQYDGWYEMMTTDDWVAYFFSLPLDGEPGTRFDYSNMASFMISAIIQESTGIDTLSYARENLFEPLGIEDVYWETSPQGIYVGASRMWLKPHDMAKFGLLYLQQGQWDGQQIVPADWIRESITPHAYPKNYADSLDENGGKDNEASTVSWVSYKFLRPFVDGYGYQWWLDRQGNFAAIGTSGQYLIVAPEENLVVMVTNSSGDDGVFFPGKLFYDYILPAVESDQAIAANPAAQHELATLSVPPALNTEPQAVPELPATALAISGKTYKLETNRWNYDNFQLIFDSASDVAEFSFTRRVHDAVSFQVGLDNVYRFAETKIGTIAAVSDWTSSDTFEITYQWIGYSAPDQLSLTFNRDVVRVTEVSLTGASTWSGEAE